LKAQVIEVEVVFRLLELHHLIFMMIPQLVENLVDVHCCVVVLGYKVGIFQSISFSKVYKTIPQSKYFVFLKATLTKVMTENTTDILENDILRRWPEVLRALLKDHTTNRNIFWATDMYERDYGETYSSLC
jgi:hypothetical protein